MLWTVLTGSLELWKKHTVGKIRSIISEPFRPSACWDALPICWLLKFLFYASNNTFPAVTFLRNLGSMQRLSLFFFFFFKMSFFSVWISFHTTFLYVICDSKSSTLTSDSSVSTIIQQSFLSLFWLEDISNQGQSALKNKKSDKEKLSGLFSFVWR